MYIVYWLRSPRSQWQICHWLIFVTGETIPTGDRVAIGTYTQVISNPAASELLAEIRRRQCRVPTINLA
ncbi:MAG: hypothetical protein P2A85_25440 [Microcoleus anatoxicus]|uniref:hypothetical protein n=1 Tax=Microcoleus anatoxicus TaxID=2705319 RepID=UPI00366D215A